MDVKATTAHVVMTATRVDTTSPVPRATKLMLAPSDFRIRQTISPSRPNMPNPKSKKLFSSSGKRCAPLQPWGRSHFRERTKTR